MVDPAAAIAHRGHTIAELKQSWLSWVLIAALSLGLAACGDKDDGDDNGRDKDQGTSIGGNASANPSDAGTEPADLACPEEYSTAPLVVTAPARSEDFWVALGAGRLVLVAPGDSETGQYQQIDLDTGEDTGLQSFGVDDYSQSSYGVSVAQAGTAILTDDDTGADLTVFFVAPDGTLAWQAPTTSGSVESTEGPDAGGTSTDTDAISVAVAGDLVYVHTAAGMVAFSTDDGTPSDLPSGLPPGTMPMGSSGELLQLVPETADNEEIGTISVYDPAEDKVVFSIDDVAQLIGQGLDGSVIVYTKADTVEQYAADGSQRTIDTTKLPEDIGDIEFCGTRYYGLTDGKLVTGDFETGKTGLQRPVDAAVDSDNAGFYSGDGALAVVGPTVASEDADITDFVITVYQ